MGLKRQAPAQTQVLRVSSPDSAADSPCAESCHPTRNRLTGPPSRLASRRQSPPAQNVRFPPAPGCYAIDVDSEFEATDGELYFGQDGHSYLGVRVADAIDAEDGGRATDSAGRSGCDAINEQVADWVGYSTPSASTRWASRS